MKIWSTLFGLGALVIALGVGAIAAADPPAQTAPQAQITGFKQLTLRTYNAAGERTGERNAAELIANPPVASVGLSDDNRRIAIRVGEETIWLETRQLTVSGLPRARVVTCTASNEAPTHPEGGTQGGTQMGLGCR